MHKINHVEVLKGYKLRLTFADGTEGAVDLSDLAGKGVFALWNDRSGYEDVRVGDRGELRWGDQIDLCPDALFLRLTGKEPEDIFPNLGRGAIHA